MTLVPIRDGVVPETDAEREIIDYCQKQLRDYAVDVGLPPTRVMIVLAGHAPDGKFRTQTNSWDVDEQTTRIENCSLAAMLFTQRALED